MNLLRVSAGRVAGRVRGVGRQELLTALLVLLIGAMLLPAGVFATNDPGPQVGAQTGPTPSGETAAEERTTRRIAVEPVETDGGVFWVINGSRFGDGLVDIRAKTAAGQAVDILDGFPVTSGPSFSLATAVPFCEGGETTGAVRVTAIDLASGGSSDAVDVPITC